MKYKSWLVYMQVLFTFLISCSHAQNSNNNRMALMIEEENKDYIKVKSWFNNKYVEHFPKSLDTSYIAFTESLSPEAGEIRFELTCKLFDDSIINSISNKSIVKYQPLDSCLLILNRFFTKENFYKVKISDDNKLLIDLKCYENKLPIPNFWTNKFVTENTSCKLPSDFIIYVLDSNPGKFLENNLLTKGEFMPTKWKNGFSKGVAISETKKVIIYWLIMW